MSKPILNHTWRVTFTERENPENKDFVHVIAPTKMLALWNAREHRAESGAAGYVVGLSPKGNPIKDDTSGFVVRNAA